MAEYNGWTNYETWLAGLWLDNDQGSYEYWQEQAQEVTETAKPEYDWETVETARVKVLAEMLESSIDDQAGELMPEAGLFSDLLNAALSEINWREIAEHYLADVEVEA